MPRGKLCRTGIATTASKTSLLEQLRTEDIQRLVSDTQRHSASTSLDGYLRRRCCLVTSPGGWGQREYVGTFPFAVQGVSGAEEGRIPPTVGACVCVFWVNPTASLQHHLQHIVCK